MNLETMTASTRAVSAACTDAGCKKLPLFDGLFIPMTPPMVNIELEKKQADAMSANLKGFLGQSVVNLAGTNVIGCPIAR
jgi:hypothetical protein